MTILDNNSTEKDIKNALYRACRNGELEQVRFILTSSELKYKPSVNEDNEAPLFNALNYGNVEIAKYLLTSKELKQHGDKYLALDMACQDDRLELVKFLFDNSHFDIDIHKQNDLAFKEALANNSNEVLKYLIFDRNIEITPEIKTFLDKSPNEQVIAWLETRQVNIDLKNELKINTIAEKKAKL